VSDKIDRRDCADSHCGCGPTADVTPLGINIGRREFLTIAGLGAAATILPNSASNAVAGPFEEKDFEQIVPRDKKLSPEWIKKLTEPGEPEVYRDAELNWIGMPIGGIGCGQLYLGGDGRLWYWDVATVVTTTDYAGKIWAGPHYEHPMKPEPVVAQGFAIRVEGPEKAVAKTLDKNGFKSVGFRGEYPIGRVSYRDEAVPVEVDLEAFSPFIPLDMDDSSIPATVFAFTVKNTSEAEVKVTLGGWLENAVCRTGDGGLNLKRRNQIVHGAKECTTLLGTIERGEVEQAHRPDIVFADFEGKDYAGWKVEGEAFADSPSRADNGKLYEELAGFEGEGLVNSSRRRAGEDSVAADRYTGKLTSPVFTIERKFIRFLIGGGGELDILGLRLIVDGKTVRQAAGHNAGKLRREVFDVREFAGKTAHFEVLDEAKGGWGHITLDQIVFTDTPLYASPRDVPGYGSMALTLLNGPGVTRAATDLLGGRKVDPKSLFEALDENVSGDETHPIPDPLVGALGRSVTIAPGETATITFVLSWWFPFYVNVSGEMGAITDIDKLARRYARRYDGAAAVADDVAERFDHLAGRTRLWTKTWYDSTLPYWLLDRVMVPANCLATSAFHAFDSGRFWGWEGVDCCPGTCQHVWQYAQSVARLFPEIERDLRERVDFGIAWHDDGAMDYRAENDRKVAHDGFCGTIIRTYREHQMSPNGAFLARIWPRVKKSVEFILGQDKDGDGLLEGEQMNTLDAAWYGPMSWISSLYLGALAAGAAMADEMDEPGFAARCRKVLDAGRKSLVAKLFNGEYFIHIPPDFKHTNTNNGCHSDQMLGQGMAWQVGLPRVVPEAEGRKALEALWRYNFTPDVGPYREKFKSFPGGRWYAMPGEGGMIVTTFPHGGAEKAGGSNPAFAHYFNESWTGFEYQVAGHMIWEGMITEGLAITRAAHERYHPAKRNPYNEVECSDHYSRAMSSHGVLVALCGFEYHGPKGFLGFAPRVRPEAFRAPFTVSEGWGTIAQERQGEGAALQQVERIAMRSGRLQVKTLAFEVIDGARVRAAEVMLADNSVPSKSSQEGRKVRISLDRELTVPEGQTLEIVLRPA
jgi:uncharacterized protein (DUF608 family)